MIWLYKFTSIDSRPRVGLDCQKRSEEYQIRVPYYYYEITVTEVVCVRKFGGPYCIESVAKVNVNKVNIFTVSY